MTDVPFRRECVCVRVIYFLFCFVLFVLFVFICFITASIRAICLAVLPF